MIASGSWLSASNSQNRLFHRSGGSAAPPKIQDSPHTLRQRKFFRRQLAFLRTLVERRWHHLSFYSLASDLNFHRRSHIPKFWRNVRQRNVLLQKRRWRSAGDISNLFSSVVQNFVTIAGNAALNHFQPDQRSFQARSLRLL